VIDITKPLRFLILGYGTSGRSTAKFLEANGHEVVIFDDNIASTHSLIHSSGFNNLDAVVKSPGVPFMSHNIHPLVKMANEVEVPVISNYDVFALYHPESRIVVITGTNGKSTTTALIHHILVKSGVKAAIGGNIGIPYGDLSEADIYIFEMSSYELAISQYMNIETCCILNIEPDHLENHGDFKNYISAKHRALDHAKFKIISSEDKYTFKKYANVADIVVSDRDNTKADIYIRERVLMDHGDVICDLSSFSELRGRHNHQNAAFAYAVCKHIGIFPKEIARYISSFKALPHRMNIVRKMGETLFINDSKATNPDAAARALDT
jgi:UDP-N-acetylmuramoylalanine--D-glutamate ligase